MEIGVEKTIIIFKNNQNHKDVARFANLSEKLLFI